MASDSVICALAFAHARQGRGQVIHEALVGSVHFEGRLCEELLRLSSDGVLRCFTPYDCERPRVSVHAREILQIEAISGLFLGRFFLWQVHTVLRVFVFCCADEAERELWISHVQQVMSQFHDSQPMVHSESLQAKDANTRLFVDSPREAATPKTPATWKSSRSNPTDVFSNMAKKAAGKVAGGAFNGLRAITGGQKVPSKEAFLLMDSTRARRWGNRRRLVLNDRILTSAPAQELRSDIARNLLEEALALGDGPKAADVTAFLDATCMLKAMRFATWSEAEQLAFWVNTYHCLLLHGFLIFGTPQTKSEMSNFRNRVSYLVGSRPMSLREIESVVLRLPRVDPQAARQARARARQLLGVIGLCGCKGKKMPKAAPATSPVSPGSHFDPGASDTLGRTLCLPKMQLPKAPWASGRIQACLYLQSPPESWTLPKQDLRVILTLNRGTLSCLSAIPVLDAEELEAQLDCMAHQFVSTFVEVQLRDGVPELATLPVWCRGILQEFQDDERKLLSFIWQYMAKEAALLPERKVRVKFKKYPQDARPRAQFFKAILADVATPVQRSQFAALGTAAKAAHCKLLTRGPSFYVKPEPATEHDFSHLLEEPGLISL